jgi:hypothetical protein
MLVKVDRGAVFVCHQTTNHHIHCAVAQACFVEMSLFREFCRAPTNNTSSNPTGTQTSAVDQPPHLFDSPSPTPTRGNRRRRDSNDYGYGLEEDLVIARPARTVPITPGTTKHLKLSCEDAARIYDVESHQLMSFAEVRWYHLDLSDFSYCAVPNAFAHDGPPEGPPSQDREDAQQKSNRNFFRVSRV